MTVSILIGDVREVLKGLPDNHFDCVVTSPPYWGLRSYLDEDDPDKPKEIGLERTLGEHLAVLVAVFAEVRRVLKPTGTLWLNYGDCYATSPNGRSAADTKASGTDDRTFRDKPFSTIGPIYETGQSSAHTRGRQGRSGNLGNGGVNGVAVPSGRVVAGGYLKNKDLCMVPNRLAIALQEAGWWVRSEIIWGKTNPMPDSNGAFRPATAHEKIFMLAKTDDGPVWRARDTGELSFSPNLSERCALKTNPGKTGARWIRIGAHYDADAVKQEGAADSLARYERGRSDDHKYADGGPGGQTIARSFDHMAKASRKNSFARRSKDSDGTHGQKPQFREDRENVNYDGERFLRNYEPAPLEVWSMATVAFSEAHFATFPPELAERCLTAGCPPLGQVLDPFGGAGTVGLVAERLGFNCTLIELDKKSAAIAQRRIRADLGKVSGADDRVGLKPTALFGDAA